MGQPARPADGCAFRDYPVGESKSPMSGILPAGPEATGSALATVNAPGRLRGGDDCLRARRAACHRSVIDAASPAALEAQAAACGVMHRHFEGRRHRAEACAQHPAGAHAPQEVAGDKHDADGAIAAVESRRPATSAMGADPLEASLPSPVIAVAMPRHASSLFAPMWSALAALVNRLPWSSQARAAAARAPSAAVRTQALPALGFREFTAPRRKPLGAPSQLRTKSAAYAVATPVLPLPGATRP